MGLLSEQRLWVVSGKGGVGKSTISAGLAVASAQAGKRTLVCEINATERISGFLERDPAGSEISQLDPHLFAVNIDPAQAMREYALMILRFETIYKAVFENRFMRAFLRYVPSTQELVLLGKVLFHLQEKKSDGGWVWDRIVMDAPATGHAISFLSVPQVILDTVPPGPLSKEAAVMRDLLVDPKTTGAVLVSLPEDMPVNETIDLHRELSTAVRVKTSAIVLNQYVPERFKPEDVEAVPSPLQPMLRQRSSLEDQSEEAKERLTKELGLPLVTVPRLFTPRMNRAGIERIASHLKPLWGAA